jgi:hypothetical protein
MLAHDSCATLDWYPPGVVDTLAPRWRPTLLRTSSRRSQGSA